MISLIIEPTSVPSGLLSKIPIRTSRLIIREFQISDASRLFDLHRDARATRYAGGTRTKEESSKSLYRIINRVRQTGYGTFALQIATNRDLIGWAGIQKTEGTDNYEILYALAYEHWHQGFATEAATSLLKAAFDITDNPPSAIFGLVYPQNIGSIRVLEKIGLSFIKYHFDETTQRYACLYSVSRKEFEDGLHTKDDRQSSSKK